MISTDTSLIENLQLVDSDYDESSQESRNYNIQLNTCITVEYRGASFEAVA